MSGNDADRIARARAQQQKMQENVAEQRELAELRATWQSLAYQLQQEIPVVLQLLASYNYPGIEIMNLPWGQRRWTDRLLNRSTTKGGWKLGEYRQPVLDGTATIRVSLLSSGQILYTGPYGSFAGMPGDLLAQVPAEYKAKVLQTALDGLRRLRNSVKAK